MKRFGFLFLSLSMLFVFSACEQVADSSSSGSNGSGGPNPFIGVWVQPSTITGIPDTTMTFSADGTFSYTYFTSTTGTYKYEGGNKATLMYNGLTEEEGGKTTASVNETGTVLTWYAGTNTIVFREKRAVGE